MKTDNKLSSILHVILHLAEHNQAMTSETLALYLKTNPVVIRRMMAGLRQAGLVVSVKGHGGGWTMAKPLAAISLLDVYQALGAPRLFAQGYRQEAPQCLIEQAVNASLDSAFAEAERQLLQKFNAVNLSDIAADFELRYQQHLLTLEHSAATAQQSKQE
ncbi:Rrf2 family transcriptional regulator [Rheinheimera soli]|uniref:Rrf2 family transcriptional regulator n=1 Tax=Rheinheimera soli TaxID=443616 RepID=UPI001E31233B|nr:Rrf2 family transcriptional regulator [Rheinheimera soli]